MLESLVINTVARIDTINKMVCCHQEIISSCDARERLLLREYTVSSCVTKLYAVYENFVKNALSDYLDTLSEKIRFESLSHDFKKQYRIGISQILSRIEHNKYKDLTHENVIKWYHEALENNEQYRFVNKALITHDQNLRLQIIENVFGRLQLKGLDEWLSNSTEIIDLYQDKVSIYEQLDSEISNFVRLRNDASHGVVDNLESQDTLERYCLLIKTLISSISTYLNKEILETTIIEGGATKLGVITETLKRQKVNIIQLEKNISINTCTEYHFIGSNSYILQNINSMQVDGENLDTLISPNDDYEVGIKSTFLLKNKVKVYSVP